MVHNEGLGSGEGIFKLNKQLRDKDEESIVKPSLADFRDALMPERDEEKARPA